MTKPLNNALGLVLFGVMLLHADFQASRWKYRRPIPVDAAALAPNGVLILNVGRDLYIHSRPGLGDLRIMKGPTEVPYVLETISGTHRLDEVSNGVVEQGVNSSGDLQLTLDVGVDRRHNGVRIATSRTNFRQRVGIFTSDDQRHWLLIRDDAYIFDFSQADRRVSILEVSYPVSSRRYVRAVIHGWNNPKAVKGAWATIEDDHAPIRDTVATLTPAPQQDAKTQATLYTWDLGIAGIPHDQLALDIDTPAFQRATEMETSFDGKEWSTLSMGIVWRFPKEHSFTLDFPESHQQFLRLRIFNQDDRPLNVKAATLSVIRRRLIFKPSTGAAPCWLYYGNSDTHSPSYDLSTLLAREAPSPETTIVTGAEESNADYREKLPPTPPWSERHPAILYFTLAVAVLGMGTVTVRFLKKATAQKL
jgi:hypothetical protein